jgi:glutathione S-transferase
MTLTVYGVPLSQPARAVLWALVWKGAPFTLVPVSPGSRKKGGTRHPDYLRQINAAGTMPAINDDGFVVAESHAILQYLCETRGWDDLYPSGEAFAFKRAKIQEYLHFHHGNTRQGSTLFAAKVRSDLRVSAGAVRGAKRATANTVDILEEHWLRDGRRFLVGDTPTIADLSAYTELCQHGAGFSNTGADLFEGKPRVVAWMARCSQLPGHDTVHLALRKLGDLSKGPPEMKTVVGANKAGLKAIMTAAARAKL